MEDEAADRMPQAFGGNTEADRLLKTIALGGERVGALSGLELAGGKYKQRRA